MGCSGITCDGMDIGEAEDNGNSEIDEDVVNNKGVRDIEGGCVGGNKGMDDDERMYTGGRGKFLLVPELAGG